MAESYIVRKGGGGNKVDAYEDYLRTYDSGYYKQSLSTESDEGYSVFWLELFADYVDKLNNGGLV